MFRGQKRKFPFARKGGPRRKKGSASGGKSWFLPGGSQRSFTAGRPTQLVLHGNIGIPSRIFVKLRTSWHAQAASTSGAFATAKFCKLNSIIDPTGTLTTIQPVGYPFYFAGWQEYTVHAAKLTIVGQVSAGAVPQEVVIAPASNTASVPADMNTAKGQPYARQMLPGLTGTAGPYRVSCYVTMGQVLGQSKADIQSDNTFSALVTADPSSLVVMNGSFQSADLSTTTTLTYTFDLIQWVEFFNRKLVAAA